MQTINGFYFDKAKYRLSDSAGNEIFLAIDYQHGEFELIEVIKAGRGMGGLKKQAATVARGLIERKRNVNFSGKIAV